MIYSIYWMNRRGHIGELTAKLPTASFFQRNSTRTEMDMDDIDVVDVVRRGESGKFTNWTQGAKRARVSHTSPTTSRGNKKHFHWGKSKRGGRASRTARRRNQTFAQSMIRLQRGNLLPFYFQSTSGSFLVHFRFTSGSLPVHFRGWVNFFIFDFFDFSGD